MQSFQIFASPRGLTLTELMVSIVLIGILMIGVVSVDFSTRKIEQTTRKDVLTSLRAEKIMIEVSRAVAQMTGFRENLGYTFSGNDYCFRQDNVLTPGTLTDDTYQCFTYLSPVIYKCTKNAPGSCTASDTLVGSATSFTITPIINPAWNSADPSSQSFYMDIHISSIFDPTKAIDPLNNPEILLDSRVLPTMHSY